MKINDFILPFVKLLKSNLKNGLVTEKVLNRLFDVLDNEYGEQKTDVLAVSSLNQCQFLKMNGLKCTNKAMHENKYNGVMVWSCNLHYKKKINVKYEDQVKRLK